MCKKINKLAVIIALYSEVNKSKEAGVQNKLDGRIADLC